MMSRCAVWNINQSPTVKVLHGGAGARRLVVGQSGVSFRFARVFIGVDVDGWLVQASVYLGPPKKKYSHVYEHVRLEIRNSI